MGTSSFLRLSLDASIPEDIQRQAAQSLERLSSGSTLSGQVFLITRPRDFFPEVIAGRQPPAGSFVPHPGAVQVQLVFAGLLSGLALPGFSVTANTGGIFSLPAPPAGMPQVQLRVRLPDDQGGFGVLAYRSAPFVAADLIRKPLQIFIFALPVPDSFGVTQQTVNAGAAEALASEELEDLDTLSAAIINGGLRVVATQGRATVTLKLSLRPSAAVSLSQTLSTQLSELTLDLPRLTACVVNEDKLVARIEAGVSDMAKDINAGVIDALVAALADAQGGDPASLAAAFEQILTLTFLRARFPAIESQAAASGTQLQRVIVFEPSFGFPRVLP